MGGIQHVVVFGTRLPVKDGVDGHHLNVLQRYLAFCFTAAYAQQYVGTRHDTAWKRGAYLAAIRVIHQQQHRRASLLFPPRYPYHPFARLRYYSVVQREPSE